MWLSAVRTLRTLLLLAAVPATSSSSAAFPEWCYSMKVWPFDLLFPDTSDSDIRENLDRARDKGANTVIFYIEEEQMYGTIVDDVGWSRILNRIGYLITQAHPRKLKVIVYLNGLEVMAHDACNDESVPTLARAHPDWLQLDIKRRPMAWTCIENDWITEDMEDAWASPYSGFRDLIKRRLKDLGGKGLDGVYVDQASLPGLQDFGDNWASADSGFSAAFRSRYGLKVPASTNWSSVAWRKFVYFRHEAIVDYLGDLATTARAYGIEPFFEASSNDTRDGTLLGNDPAMTVTAGIAYSPEIEPEGDFSAAFRMAKFARDISPTQPILYLGWPASLVNARKEFAIATAVSGNYYPTADSPYPSGAFKFLDSLRAPVLNRRTPYAEAALMYSARNKDWTYPTDATFEAYTQAFVSLAESHVPFRIVSLESITAADIERIGSIVLAEIASLSDAEFDLLKTHPVALVGDNGTRDEWYRPRKQPLQFPTTVPISTIKSELPFQLTAPAQTYIEYFTDASNRNRFFLFAFTPDKSGSIELKFTSALTAKLYELDRRPRTLRGATITIPIQDYLEVIDLTGSFVR
ncbi:MAG: hypothetical protein HYX75_06480 [Acidobacteria bacterium]|nr:hypothetical protein [Acidobacteriota bacterium]